ncbi:hypothetical protein K1X22_26420 [Mycolicibacterium farcinogenes]|uniref:hypothetical protein n=1 Tax=Mycolicibacterium farcinogenes TaxID=1802 RepID=UPI001C8CFFD4|nr:hypothetical protein [Mycolicibacterium farcinogenes]QZH59658.1 hypothetical protein K1X22_26420 [Mycolicibacterium farcinogenes]
MPGENEYVYPLEYVAARAVLLDALDALDGHLPTIIIVGAQAVYLHTGAGDFVEPPMTTDGDLALDAESLKTSPEITAAMAAADFKQGANPGRWTGRGEVAVDIMVAPFQSGRTAKDARSARLIGHEKWAARPTAGLEPALIDNSPHILRALAEDDHRCVEVKVAGPAALLVAKIIKFEERLNDTKAEGKRVKQKDALDMLRLLQAVDTADLIGGLLLHFADSHARDVSIRALRFLEKEGTSATSALPQAAAAVDGGNPTTAPSFAALAQDLLGHVRDELGVTP